MKRRYGVLTIAGLFALLVGGGYAVWAVYSDRSHGERFFFRDPTRGLGELQVGVPSEVAFEVSNQGNEPLTVVGAAEN